MTSDEVAAAVERAEWFVREVWPRVCGFGDPFREAKTLARAMADDVLRLAADRDCAALKEGA